MAQLIAGERAGDDLAVHEFNADADVALSSSADVPEATVPTLSTI